MCTFREDVEHLEDGQEVVDVTVDTLGHTRILQEQ